MKIINKISTLLSYSKTTATTNNKKHSKLWLKQDASKRFASASVITMCLSHINVPTFNR